MYSSFSFLISFFLAIDINALSIIGSPSPGVLVLLADKQHVIVLNIEQSDQSGGSVTISCRVAIRIPLFDAQENFTVVCEGKWIFALLNDTGFIRILFA